MSTNEKSLKQLMLDIKTWENQSIEFKKKSTSDHELAEAIAGFATANFGRIYVGVSDKRKIVGVDGAETGSGKDKFLRRIAHITRDIVKPPIRVMVDFIKTDSGVVARIDVPKGEKPVYWVDYKPYTRDLSVTRKLESSEVGNLYRQHFLARIPPAENESIDFLTETVMQLSDIQVIFSDYQDHLINPDVHQMQYDLGATGRRLSGLSAKQVAKDMGVVEELRKLGDKLEDLEAYEFYMGRASVDEFGKKGEECTKLANRLYEQVKKNMPSSVLPNYSQVVIETIESFTNEWAKAPRYMERGEPERLRDTFRRFGYTFHRLGSLPEADKHDDLSVELREVGEKIRNLSSTEKYFVPVAMWNPVEKVRKEMKQILNTLGNIKKTLQISSVQ